MNYFNADVTYSFADSVPDNYSESPIVISGGESLTCNNREYIILRWKNYIRTVYELRYPSWGGPYKEAIYFNSMLAVGHYQFFYLFDLTRKCNIVRLEVSGYFGHMYIHKNNLYITDASSIYCFNGEGEVIWRNCSLGIDGVYIVDFTQDKILARGQWDPPDGWQDIELNKINGEIII